MKTGLRSGWGRHLLLWPFVIVAAFAIGQLHKHNASCWASSLLLYAIFTLCLILICDLAERVTGKGLKTLRIKVTLLFALLFAVDVGLRISGGLKTYFEQNGSPFYYSMYMEDRDGDAYHTYKPNSVYSYTKSEYSYKRKINSLGLPCEEIPEQKPKDEYRVFALGDSYTEGVGATADSAFPAVFQRCLQQRLPSKKVKVFNAGVSGNDLLYVKKMLEDKLLRLRPDALVLMVNHSDIDDVVMRGGPERFAEDGTLQLKAPPWWEVFYANSFLVRYFVIDILGYDQKLISSEEAKTASRQAVSILHKTLEYLQEIAHQHQLDHFTVATPTYPDYRDKHYNIVAFKRLISQYKFDLDLLSQLIESGTRDSIPPSDIYWPVDMHYNGRGYTMIGRMICEAYYNKYFAPQDSSKKNNIATFGQNATENENKIDLQPIDYRSTFECMPKPNR